MHGIGRTPLREALQRLEAEGLVQTVPRRGTFVTHVTAHDIRALYELRCNLDAFAAELAAERATPLEVATMEETLQAAADAPDEVDRAAFDERMHGLIVAASHNPLLEDFHRRLYDLTIRVLSLQGMARESLQDMLDEFRPIVAAIGAGEAEEAGRATLRHVMARGWFPDLDPHLPRREHAFGALLGAFPTAPADGRAARTGAGDGPASPGDRDRGEGLDDA